MDRYRSPGPLRRRIVLPSFLAAFLPFALVWLPGARWHLAALLAAAVLTLAIAVAAVAVRWERLPESGPSALAFAYLAVIALLRNAGGPSGVGPIILLPVFWIGVCGTRRQLAAMVGAIALILLLPLALIGGSAYPPATWRAAILFVAASGLVGWTIQVLVAYANEQELKHHALLDQLQRQASTDSLTMLPNRRTWDAKLLAGLEWARGTGDVLTIGLIDLDGLKAVNDSDGHSAGDLLLTRVARQWTPVLRRADLLARIGGDEFAILLHGATESEAAEVIDRLRERTPIPYTCSAGIASWNGDESATELMRRADEALYAAKREGRNRAVAAA
jgi:diguanylate cyclase (GGDEF)-like protein